MKTKKTTKKLPKLGSGERYEMLKNKISKQYEKKGISNKKAEDIAEATSAKIAREKYGNAKVNKMAQIGRKRALKKINKTK